MADTTDVLLHLIDENWTQARQSEDQRATMSNLIVIIAAALSGVVTQTGYTINSLPLAVLLIVLGVFGVVATAKFYERSQFHVRRARKLRHRLNELCTDAQIQILYSAADKDHEAKFKYPIILRRIPVVREIHLYQVWLSLHVFIALLGVIFTVIIISKFWN